VIDVSAQEIGPNDREKPAWRQMPSKRKHRARQLDLARGPSLECDAVDQTKTRDAVGKPDRGGLRHAPSHVVSYQTREVYPEMIEHPDDSIGVRAEINSVRVGRITSSVTQQIQDDHAMSRGEERDDGAPQMTRRGEAVQQDDGFTCPTRPGGVVVEADSVQVEELTAHSEKIGNGELGK